MDVDRSIIELDSRVALLESDLVSRVEVLERRLEELRVGVAVRPGPAAPPPLPRAERKPVPPPSTPPPPPRPGDAVGPATPGPAGSGPSRPRVGFEIGMESVLRWIGIALVVLAAVFLVSTAIDRGWIGPELQLLGATLIGAGLLVGALVLSRWRRPWARALGIGGSVVVIVCAGAAYGWLELWGPVTGLGAVAIAAAVALAAAMRLRMESVAIAATAAMLIVPGWARIIADGPVAATGLWLGLFAITATVVGLERRWVLYRVVSTWAVAGWVLGLGEFLSAEGNTEHGVIATVLISVVAAVLWVGPALARSGRSMAAASDRERTLAAIDHRSLALLPVWAWYSLLLLRGIDVDGAGGPIGLGLAAGFIVVAVAAWRLWPAVSDVLFASHLLGAGILATVSIVAWLSGPTLLVVLAGQAVATLIIGRLLADDVLQINGAILAGAASLLLAEGLGEAIDRSIDPISDPVVGMTLWGERAGHLAAILLLWAVAWLVDRDRPRPQAELVNGVVWALTSGFVVSLLAPVVDGRGWLVVGVALAGVGLLVAERLGRLVLAIGASIAVVTVAGAAASMIDAAVDGAGLGGHLANLAVVAALGLATRWFWSDRPRPAVARPLLVLAWLSALGWWASVFLAEVSGSQGQVSITAGWAVAAAAAIVAAIRTDESVVRSLGLGTLGLVLVKLLSVDLAEVDTLWRVGLFLVVGLGLLRLGYVLPALAVRHRAERGTVPS